MDGLEHTNHYNRLFNLAIFGICQFLVLSVLAMVLYSGGSSVAPQDKGYSILNNLLSDLGRTVSYSGESNLSACLIYNVSLFILGCLLIPFFIEMPRFLRLDTDVKWFSIPGSIAGIVMSGTFIGASLTPADILLDIHLMLGQVAFITGLPLAIAYTMAIITSDKFPKRYAYVFAIFGVVQFLFLLVMFQSLGGSEITVVFAIGQKIAVYGLVGCILIQCYGVIQYQGY